MKTIRLLFNDEMARAVVLGLLRIEFEGVNHVP
jgi:hypothetical protein